MIYRIKNRIEKELHVFIDKIDGLYGLSGASPLLFRSIRGFFLRKGKRIRPILFLIGYLGFKGRQTKNLYTSALSIELLHDFLLIHDDIIDKSPLRRGRPALHEVFNAYLKKKGKAKFNGADLAIVAGDVMYAAAIHAFLSIKEDARRKEKALRKLIEAAIRTGAGEFIELLAGLKDIREINKNDIYKIYDYKTACYTFSTPLSAGAILAGAKEPRIKKLSDFGICVGRAFQINDDILDMFGEEKQTGKSTLTDLKESKKTLLIWYAYNNSSHKDKAFIRKAFSKKKAGRSDLLKIRGIIEESGALDYTRKETSRLIKTAECLLLSSGMLPEYIQALSGYYKNLLCL